MNAFDVVGEKTHISSEQTGSRRRKDTYKVIFNNHLNKDIVVTDVEHIPDLGIFTSDLSFNKINNNTFQYEAKVPSGGTSELTYSVETRM